MALLLVPWPLAFLTVPNLLGVLRSASAESVVMALLFGAGWGVGGVFFGLGIAALGLSLGLSLIMGLVAIGGSLVPLMMKYPEQLLRPAGLVLMAGIVVMILGLVACARAGQLKEKSTRRSEPGEADGQAEKASFKLGLCFCIASGLTSALVNFGLIFGAEIAHGAVLQGATPSNANNAIWALVFTSNYLVNIGYCLFLLKKNHSLANFSRGGGAPWAATVYLGVFWAGGIVVYGMGATGMGQFGAFLGYPVMLIVSILTGNSLGVLTGEWKGVSARPKRAMTVGVCLLMLAIVVLAYSSRLIS